MRGIEETEAPEGKMKGLCSWHWLGTDLDQFGEMVQEVWDEKIQFE